eukprot:gene8568-6009_t
MSFRYTNDLIRTLRHRLLLEAAQRRIARCEFTGVCRGIQVRISGFGAVLSISPHRAGGSGDATGPWDDFYYAAAAPGRTESEPAGVGARRLRVDRVAQSIQAATWAAQQKRRAAKADAIHRSLRGATGTTASSLSTSVVAAVGTPNALRHWFEDDPEYLARLMPHLHLTVWCGTPRMKAAYYGIAEDDLPPSSSTRLADVLRPEHCNPLAVPIGSLHHLHTPALLQLEEGLASTRRTPPKLGSDESMPLAAARSRVSLAALRQAQRREMRYDEENFWARVDLIRRAQMGTIGASEADKRPYKDMAAQLKGPDELTEKVQLRFTQ